MMALLFWAAAALLYAADEISRELDLESQVPSERTLTPIGSVDFQYATNGPVAQGFLIPRLLLGAAGKLTRDTHYTLVVGQVREVSSVQLPLLVPREVQLNFGRLGEERTSLRVGLFRPTFNPKWITRLNGFPDYLGTHSALFLTEQVGAEIVYDLDGVSFGGGMTNGNGLLALNTNNSRAFNLFLRGSLSTSTHWGLSAYSFRQSTPGGANYRDNWAANLYCDIDLSSISMKVGAELLAGGFLDSDSSLNSRGWAAYIFLPFLGSELLIRAENLDASPTLSGRPFKQFQMGPVFKPTIGTELFIIEQYSEPGVTAGELTTFARLRLEL